MYKRQQYYDDCYPVTAEMRKAINKAVMTAYENNATAVIKSEPEAIATKVKVIPNNNPDSNLKGFAQITMDDCFVVSGVKVFDGENGMFLQLSLIHICISKGFADNATRINLNWLEVAKRIQLLINNDRYLNEKEKEHYAQWLNEREERQYTEQGLSTSENKDNEKYIYLSLIHI